MAAATRQSRPAAQAAGRAWLQARAWASGLPAPGLPPGVTPALPPWALTAAGAAVLVTAAAAAGVVLFLLLRSGVLGQPGPDGRQPIYRTGMVNLPPQYKEQDTPRKINRLTCDSLDMAGAAADCGGTIPAGVKP